MLQTKHELTNFARRFGYSIRRIGGEYRLVDDRTNSAFYRPRTLEEIADFLSCQDSDGEKPAIFG